MTVQAQASEFELNRAAFPWCEGCAAMARKYILPNTIDHRLPISDGSTEFPSYDGLASFSASCHSAKTVRGPEAGGVRTTKPPRGCDADGNPLDPAHPWVSG